MNWRWADIILYEDANVNFVSVGGGRLHRGASALRVHRFAQRFETTILCCQSFWITMWKYCNLCLNSPTLSGGCKVDCCEIIWDLWSVGVRLNRCQMCLAEGWILSSGGFEMLTSGLHPVHTTLLTWYSDNTWCESDPKSACIVCTAVQVLKL